MRKIGLIICFLFGYKFHYAQNKYQSVSSFSEFAINDYHNLSLLPQEWLNFIGVGYYRELLQSGDEYGIGIQTDVKFAHSLKLSKVFAMDIPVFAVLRLGGGDFIGEGFPFAIRLGAGFEYYYNFAPGWKKREDAFRPTWMAQLDFSWVGRPIYFRYSKMFTSDYLTKQSFQFGVFFPL